MVSHGEVFSVRSRISDALFGGDLKNDEFCMISEIRACAFCWVYLEAPSPARRKLSWGVFKDGYGGRADRLGRIDDYFGLLLFDN
jgi:hypothetical protein